MAKLHRRVPRLPHPHVLIAAALLALAAGGQARAQDAPAEVAAAGDPRLARLDTWLTDLRADDEARRRAAYDAVTTLDAEMLPAIRARLARVRRHRPDRARAFELFNRIRRGAGSTRADDDVDIAPGVLVVLREDRSERMMQMVEPLLLWRALERLGTFEAGQAMYPLIGLDGDVWRWEERRVVSRMGKAILAAAIVGRGHSERAVRDWASATVRRLGAEEPGLAVQELEPTQLADVLRAFAMARVQSAMRVIVSFVDSERRSVRRAARWALEQYGGNAIWVLRTEYRNQTGERAPESLGWRRLSEALYAKIDAQRTEPMRQAREAGLAALQRGELEEARRQLADVLARAPELEDARPVADAYAVIGATAAREWALAQAREPGGGAPQHQVHLDRAEEAYWRALRLDPAHPEAARWRAALAFVEGERSRSGGVLDDGRYREVLAVDPTHEGALAALAMLELATPPEIASSGPDRWPLGAAVVLAVLGGALLLIRRREELDEDAESLDTVETATPPELAYPFDPADATLADSTLPG